MQVFRLISQLQDVGVRLRLVGDKLECKLPPDGLSEPLLELLKANKEGIKSFLKSEFKLEHKRSIVRGNSTEIELSFSQLRLWFIDRLNSGSPEYNLPKAFVVHGELNVEVVEQAISRIISRHEVLRTVYKENDNGPFQLINNEFIFKITKHDFSSISADAKKTELQSLIELDVNKSFDLTQDLMIRVSFVILNDSGIEKNIPQKSALLFNMHHIASDGWSMEVLVSEFVTQYKAILGGAVDPLPPLEIQYSDYVHWQKEWLQGEMLDLQFRYWDNQLAGLPQVHSLVLDNPRPNVKQSIGGHISSKLTADVAVSLQQLAKHYHLTPFMLLHGALSLVLSRHSNSADIVIGTPVANRPEAELESLIGFFVNTLVLRVDTAYTQLADYFSHVRQVNLDAQSNQDLPFEQLVERLNVQRSTAHTPLFQIMLTTNNDFNLGANATTNLLSIPGIDITPLSGQNIPVEFDLTIDIKLSNEVIDLNWAYDKSIFNELHVSQINDHLCHVLTALAELDDKAISAKPLIKNIPMLSHHELDYLCNTLNDNSVKYENNKCIHEMFEQQVNENPDNTAVVFENSKLTYQELNHRANQVAHYLIDAQNVKPDTLIGICVERSLDMVIGILGVLKAGAAYVPLDPDYPKVRLEYMIENANLTIILTQKVVLAEIDFGDISTIILGDSLFSCYSKYNIDKGSLGLKLSHLAYVIYTSGSTGKPKGVMVEHEQLNSFISNAKDSYQIQHTDNILQFSTMNFDIFVEEYFCALSHGATLVLRNEACLGGLSELYNFCQQNQVSLISLPTAFWHQLMLGETLKPPETLRLMVVGGEALQKDMVESWFNQDNAPKLINTYGPTETTIAVCSYQIEHSQINHKKIPIGKANINVCLYVLDELKRVSPYGTVGELYIGGSNISRGYFNNHKLTANSFIDNPYYSANKINSSKRLYKTGDLVRYLPDGNLEFIGRIDDQVKIYGYRIELGEIEHQLNSCEGVDSSIVLVNQYAKENKQLIAYVKLHLTCETKLKKSTIIELAKETLQKTLPGYMLPSAFVLVVNWPLTINGKLDKTKLLEMKIPKDTERSHVKARNDLEKILCQIWCEILQRDTVGIKEPFFEIGGNSLLSIAMQRKINARTVFQVNVIDIFTYPTIEMLANFLQQEEPVLQLSAPKKNESAKYTDDIAIIGMACRFPDATTPEEYWNNLCAGKESIREFTNEELVRHGTPNELFTHRNLVKYGVLLDDLEMFDAMFFGFTPKEAQIMDPQQRLLMECVNDAFENGGYGHYGSSGDIGVFVGVSDSRYLYENILSNLSLINEIGLMNIQIGNGKDFSATRISHKFNLTGPSVNVNTACSTSLVAVNQACMSLIDGSSDMAVAGAASISLLRPTGYIAEEGGIMSSDGHCRPFDSSSQGTRVGSGAGVVLLKRLADAIADNDPIQAVIKGSAVNNDGADKVGFTAPSVRGQAQVIQSALSKAKVDPSSIEFIETHGTGTNLGDLIEIRALNYSYGNNGLDKNCALGFVKANLGHLDSAAGMAGLIKTVQMLKYRTLPPNINYTEPNPELDLDNSPFYINKNKTDWNTKQNKRRAGVSSFGIGGTNAHLILEEAPVFVPSVCHGNNYLIILSAKSEKALSARSNDLLGHIEKNKNLSVADIAYTLGKGRSQYEYRYFCLAKNLVELKKELQSVDVTNSINDFVENNREVQIVFMFPGQGSQYINMGREIFLSEPVFRNNLEKCAKIIEEKLGVDICDIIYPQVDSITQENRINETSITQPLLFAFEFAMVELWISWGVCPTVMIGHSLGEYVAACISGVFSLEDALNLVMVRGELMQSVDKGVMLSISLSQHELMPLLDEFDCDLAAVNTATSCVASGSELCIEKLKTKLDIQNVTYIPLKTSHAFHSGMMEPILEEFLSFISTIKLNKPSLPFFSNVSGKIITAKEATDPCYWSRHLRETVQFSKCVEQFSLDGEFICLEVGPGRTLSSFVRSNVKSKSTTILHSIMHETGKSTDNQLLLNNLGQLWCSGVHINWDKFYSKESGKRLSLPCYSYDKKHFWVEPGENLASAAFIRAEKSNNDVNEFFYEPVWKTGSHTKNKNTHIKENECLLKSNECCLLFVDSFHVIEHLGSKLRLNGHNVIYIYKGKRFIQESESIYHINPAKSQDYSSLFEAVKEGGKQPRLILHGWNISGVQQKEWEYSDNLLNLNLYSLLYLCQTLDSYNFSQNIEIKIFSSNQQFFDTGDIVHPEKSTLTGVCQVIHQEYPNIECQCIDIPEQDKDIDDNLLTLLFAEAIAETKERVICFRENQRWFQSFEKITLPTLSDRESILKDRGVYLITGGLGGIGFSIAEFLAESVQAKLILVGRSSFPKRQEWDSWLSENEDDNKISKKLLKIRELENLGAEVLLCQTNISVETDVQLLLNTVHKKFGSIDGCIHSAGIAGGGLISLKTMKDMGKVIEPKIQGTALLSKKLMSEGLDFFLNCSSLTSIIGGVGQYDYCAANAFQDAFSFTKLAQKTKYISINWDAWAETGMAFDTNVPKRLQKLKEQHLSNAITIEEGKDIFNRAVNSSHTQLIVSKEDFISLVEVEQTKTEHENVELSDIDEMPNNNRPMIKTDYVAPRYQIEFDLAKLWNSLLGIDKIGINDHFMDLGGDSLLLSRLVVRINEKWGIHFPLKLAFEKATISQLALLLSSHFSKDISEDFPIIDIEEEVL